MDEAFSSRDAWSEDYDLDLAMKKALESREAADFLDQLTEMPAPAEAPTREPVSAYFSDKLSKVRQNIEGLRRELEVRRGLHHRFREEIDYQISRAAFSLKEFQFWGIGYNRGVDIKRNFLERQLADFRHKRRQDELRFWDDLVESRRKLRDALSEYGDALRRARLVGETK